MMHHSPGSVRIRDMGTSYEQLFKACASETVPAYLCEQICQALSQERMRRERMRLLLSSLSGAGSLAGLAFALPALSHAAAASGFSEYAPLLLSDGDLAVSHAGTFLMPLAESLPGPEVTLALFLIAVLLVSLRNVVVSAAYARSSFAPLRKAV